VRFYTNLLINSIMIPENTPSEYSNRSIFIFSFMFLLLLNNTSNAVPLPVNNPDISDAKFIALFRYNSVNITLAPQFGINPIKLVINGPNIVFFRNNFDKYVSPR